MKRISQKFLRLACAFLDNQCVASERRDACPLRLSVSLSERCGELPLLFRDADYYLELLTFVKLSSADENFADLPFELLPRLFDNFIAEINGLDVPQLPRGRPVITAGVFGKVSSGPAPSQ